MNLRDFLERREGELEEEIQGIRAQMGALQLSLVPLEGELAEVRRAKGAVGTQSSQGTTLAEYLTGFGSLGAVALGGEPTIASETSLGKMLLDLNLIGTPPERMTMKELVIYALHTHFLNGATTRKLLDFFRDAYGRNIERTNLSPQLSRLFQEGKIGRAPPLKEWHLVREIAAEGVRAFVQRHNKEVVYMLPSQARPDEVLPILTASDPLPDPDED